MNNEIEKILVTYIKAFYQQDFKTMINLFYEEDLKEFRDTFVFFAERFDVFGETSDFLQKIKVEDLQTLKSMSINDFVTRILALSSQTIGKSVLKDMVKNLKITNIDEADVLTIVQYEIPIKVNKKWHTINSDVNMIFTSEGWKILFKSGLNTVLSRFNNEIDAYYKRKKRDNVNEVFDAKDIQKQTLVGFQTSDGKTIIEPRFKHAGNFSEGLAFVQVFQKYGYIDLTGEIVIQPNFYDAHDFSEGRAAVKMYVENEGFCWGFIDINGKIVIPCVYSEVSNFSEGLCATRLNDEWGYIDKKGTVVIKHQFETAYNFYENRAEVSLLNKKNKIKYLTLDKQGNIID